MNALSYRLIHEQSILYPRSRCTSCHRVLSWYELIPVISWLALRGHCRTCTSAISWLYPFIELLTPCVMLPLVVWVPLHYVPAYFLFFSALIITIRSDIDTMLISRFVTLFLLPLGFVFSYVDLLPISLEQSVLGALVGYFFLFFIATTFKWLTKKDGMGQGDLELLAFIGSFTGILGCWISLLMGSIIGSVCGIAYLVLTGKKSTVKIPFGPFLAFGAIFYVLWHDVIINVLFVDIF